MNKYKLYGLIIETEEEFFQLEKAKDSEPADVFIRQEHISNTVLKYLEEHGALECRYDIGFEYSCFFNIGGYYIIRDGKEIIFERNEGVDKTVFSSWILGFCTAMLLLQRRMLAIHCSAVTDGKRAFLISGEPGAGKSTLTRCVLEKGYKLMADDVAAVKLVQDKAYVYPAFPYQKLCRNEVVSRNLDMSELIYINEEKDKFLVPVKDDFVSEPMVLDSMIFLVAGDVKEVHFEQLRGMNQLFSIKSNLFLHKLPGDWEKEKELIQECLDIASKCSVYLAVRPREGDSTYKIMDEFLKAFNK